jgi:DNA-binding NarL/FixJ family response regulator
MADTMRQGRLLAVPGRNAESLGWASAILSWSGYRVDRASTAEEALQMLRSAPYDVLLLGYDSSPEDVLLSTELVQDPDVRVPTLMFITDDEEFIPPTQQHFVPTGYVEPQFTQEHLIHMVETLRQYKA